MTIVIRTWDRNGGERKGHCGTVEEGEIQREETKNWGRGAQTNMGIAEYEERGEFSKWQIEKRNS